MASSLRVGLTSPSGKKVNALKKKTIEFSVISVDSFSVLLFGQKYLTPAQEQIELSQQICVAKEVTTRFNVILSFQKNFQKKPSTPLQRSVGKLH